MEFKIITNSTLNRILKVIPRGQGNAITTRELMAAFELDNRSVKRAIAMLRESGAPICADWPATGGYFLPETQKEAQDYLRIKRKQLKSEQRALEPVIKYCRYAGAGGDDK
jgi:predicted DNA-binding transcriptional regulator YafY